MKLIYIFLYPMALICRSLFVIFSFDYKQFLINLTNPDWKPNIIAGKALRISIATALLFILFSFINALLN